MDATTEPVKLHSAGGANAPPSLASDLRRLTRMPSEAVASFWQALGPSLCDPQSPDTARTLDVFCSAYRLSEEDLGGAIRACRFLIEGAARLDLPGEKLAEDIDRLCPEHPEIEMLLLGGYEPVKAQLRREMVAGALADHGKMLVGAQWRVDVVDSSDRGARLRVPVVMLTLQYREGMEVRRITLQALPDTMGQLKKICDEVLR